MAKTTLSTIKNWFKTGSKPTQSQFWNVFDSFFHKDEKLQVSDVDQLSNYLNQKAEKQSLNNHQTSDAAHQALFDQKQDKEEGKGLSTNDLTQELYQKLIDLQNYVHPDYHQISEIKDLPEQLATIVSTLEGKQPLAPEGWGFSQQNYTEEEKIKLSGLEPLKWKGKYTSETGLKTDYPEGAGESWHENKGGWEADVDGGASEKVTRYIWDADDFIWVKQLGEANAETSTSVRQKYLSNADTENFSTAHKQKVEGLPEDVESTEGAQTKATAAKNAAIEHADTADEALATQIASKASKEYYGDNVADIAALKAIPEAEIPNGQRRCVESEGVDYFYNSNLAAVDATEDDIAPDDQQENTGFWIKNSMTSVAVQDENGVDQFKTDKNLKFKGVNFDATEQTIEVIKKLKEVVVQDKSQLLGALQSDVLYVIDGYFSLGDGETITVPAGGLNIMGYSFDASNISSNGVSNHTIFDSPAEGSGNLIIHNIGFSTTGAGSKVFDIVDADGTHAVEMVTVNFEGCQSIGKIRNYRQGTGITIGFYNCKDGLMLSGSWSGFKLTNTNCFGFDAAGTLFKRDTDTVFTNRLFLELNIDLPAGAKFVDFKPNNFAVNDLLQFNSTILKYDGVINDRNAELAIPNIRANDPKCLWRSNVGIPDTAIEKFIDVEVSGAYEIDWLNDTFNIVMTGDTTFSDKNLPASGKSTKEIQIYLSGNFKPTFPTGWNKNKVGTYKPGEVNKITLKFIKGGLYFMKIDNSLTVYPAPDLEPYEITYIPPMEQKMISIIGSFFTPQSVVEIDGTTVDDTVFVNSSRIDVTVTAGASEGNGSLRITNGTLRSFSNFVEVIDGEVFYFDESNVLSNTGLTIQDGNFSGIGKAELLSIQTNERTYITTDQYNGINKSGELDAYINFRRLDGSLFLRLDSNGDITKPDGTILNKSIKGRRIDINNGQINFIEGGGGYAHYQSYSEELIMEIEKISYRSISMGMKAKVYVIQKYRA